MARFLRPGIHSGTLPKIFGRLRRAERRMTSRRASAAARKQEGALEHVEESIERFMSRGFLGLVNQHPAFEAAPLAMGHMKLAATRIGIELRCPALGSEGAIVAFEQHNGWIIAGIDRPGWISNLGEDHARLVSVAVVGLYKMSGVDIVREQIQAMFPGNVMQCEVRRDDLLVWPAGRFDFQVKYDLLEESPAPRLAMGMTEIALPTLDRRRVLIRYIPVAWEDWVAVWNGDDSGGGAQGRILKDICVLPANVLRRVVPLAEQEAWGD